jgi:hypothetical protein
MEAPGGDRAPRPPRPLPQALNEIAPTMRQASQALSPTGLVESPGADVENGEGAANGETYRKQEVVIHARELDNQNVL